MLVLFFAVASLSRSKTSKHTIKKIATTEATSAFIVFPLFFGEQSHLNGSSEDIDSIDDYI